MLDTLSERKWCRKWEGGVGMGGMAKMAVIDRGGEG